MTTCLLSSMLALWCFRWRVLSCMPQLKSRVETPLLSIEAKGQSLSSSASSNLRRLKMAAFRHLESGLLADGRLVEVEMDDFHAAPTVTPSEKLATDEKLSQLDTPVRRQVEVAIRHFGRSKSEEVLIAFERLLQQRTALDAHSAVETRFSVDLREMIFGPMADAALGVAHYLCVDKASLLRAELQGLSALQQEFEALDDTFKEAKVRDRVRLPPTSLLLLANPTSYCRSA